MESGEENKGKGRSGGELVDGMEQRGVAMTARVSRDRREVAA